jgi:hypothetical protein
VFDDLLSFVGPAGTPATAALFTWGVFELAEKVTSKQARSALTTQLRTLKADDVAVVPAGASELFNRVFGERQWSTKCVIRSILCSVGSIVAISLISLPHRTAFIETLGNDAFTRTYLAMWVPISLAPDFINLYKTRRVIAFLEQRRGLASWKLALIVCFDFIFGLILFLTFSRFVFAAEVTFQSSKSLYEYFRFVWETLPFIVSPRVWLRYLGLAETEAPLFYPGMLASVWLWIYVFTVLARGILNSGGLLNWTIWALDIEEHPLRSIGLLAAGLVFLVVFVGSTVAQLT